MVKLDSNCKTLTKHFKVKFASIYAIRYSTEEKKTKIENITQICKKIFFKNAVNVGNILHLPFLLQT
jgi:hypothetical protein